ncbi:helix-turn-helix domain-containing protein [Phycicoccus sp. SLBN-51]|uniref:helix-turn-helix transcriptional regulator n=1 Tax=Phycicoccus sp. SLBN-51 TaxID=2768447 RepID=UPI001175B946|nr:helix-turn-helix domain-containing protein [Phycicoccus sp. SLBN-51]TQJ50261.1 transcriptional regulator [Phycicoccus sp. SLBN-51]
MNIPASLEQRLSTPGLGPRPASATAAAGAAPSRAAAAVLDQLAAHAGPVTAAALAESSGQHTNTVREHLDALVEAGLATRERAESSGRGRPAWLYAATEVQQPVVREYAGLATALAMQLARTSTHPRDDAVEAGRAWGEQLASERVTPSSPAGARREVVDLLTGLGFDPTADSRVQTVRLRQCPLIAAAREEPEVVCSVHLGIVRGALESWHTRSDETSLVPFAEPGACLLHLTGATTRTSGDQP